MHIKVYWCLTPRKMIYCRIYEQENSVSQECSKFKMICVFPLFRLHSILCKSASAMLLTQWKMFSNQVREWAPC